MDPFIEGGSNHEVLPGAEVFFKKVEEFFIRVYKKYQDGEGFNLETVSSQNQGFSPWVEGLDKNTTKEIFDFIRGVGAIDFLNRCLLSNQSKVIDKYEGRLPEGKDSANDFYSELMEEILQGGVVRGIVFDPNKELVRISLVDSVDCLNFEGGANNIRKENLREGVMQVDISISRIDPPPLNMIRRDKDGVYKAAFWEGLKMEIALFEAVLDMDDGREKVRWNKLYGYEVVAKRDVVNQPEIKPTAYTKYEE